jgi:membrane peptidoglycan carboxypeptidase
MQEGLRGVIRLPSGTAHALDGRDFPIPVMGKTGTTSDFRDALFVGSTYGRTGITVAVRIGFDDNRVLGDQETGGRAALPIFREVMLRVYRDGLVGPVPEFPRRSRKGSTSTSRGEPRGRREARSLRGPPSTAGSAPRLLPPRRRSPTRSCTVPALARSESCGILGGRGGARASPDFTT